MNRFEFASNVLLGLLYLINYSSQVDLTIEPNATGYDVTQAVVRKIYRSGLFEDDYFLVHRVAYISTKFGQDPPPSEGGDPLRGIWQLTEAQFNETLTNPNLTDFRAQIGQKFPEIGDWNSVTWADLLKPLHNGLAFRLYIQQFYEPSIYVPFDLAPWPLLVDQAVFYKSNLNSTADVDSFVAEILAFEACPKCHTEMDIVFVQDASCTIIAQNLSDTRDYTVALLDTFTFSNIRVGYIVYSIDVLKVFNLDNDFTQEELGIQILNASRPTAQYTFTATAISEGLTMIEGATTKRDGVPKVLVVLTDGEAVEFLDDVTNSTQEAGVNSFAIGLGLNWSQDELLQISHNRPGHASKSQFTFSLREEFIYRTHMEICSVPARPQLNVETEGITGLNEKINYKFSFDQTVENGLNVTVNISTGQVRVFYSYSEETPTSALHDGELEVGVGNFIPKMNDFESLFVAVNGLNTINSYKITVN